MVYETIIEEVRIRPYIYDKSSPDYKKLDLISLCFQEIANSIEEMWTVKLSGKLIINYNL